MSRRRHMCCAITPILLWHRRMAKFVLRMLLWLRPNEDFLRASTA